MGRLISVLAAVLTCAAIALSADLFRVAGLSLYTEQVLAGLLAIATPLVFLHVSARGERGRTGNVPWYDLAAAIAGFAAHGLWPWALALFVVGWIFQFVGHWYEKKPPEFLKDWRFLFVGLRWWFAKLRGRA